MTYYPILVVLSFTVLIGSAQKTQEDLSMQWEIKSYDDAKFYKYDEATGQSEEIKDEEDLYSFSVYDHEDRPRSFLAGKRRMIYSPKKRCFGSNRTDMVRYYGLYRSETKKMLLLEGRCVLFEGDPDGEFKITGGVFAPPQKGDRVVMEAFWKSTRPNENPDITREEERQATLAKMQEEDVERKKRNELELKYGFLDGGPLKGQFEKMIKWSSGNYDYYEHDFGKNGSGTSFTKSGTRQLNILNIENGKYTRVTVGENEDSLYRAHIFGDDVYVGLYRGATPSSPHLFFLEDRALFFRFNSAKHPEILGSLGKKPEAGDDDIIANYILERYRANKKDSPNAGMKAWEDQVAKAEKLNSRVYSIPSKNSAPNAPTNPYGLKLWKAHVEHFDLTFTSGEDGENKTSMDVSKILIVGDDAQLLGRSRKDYDWNYSNSPDKKTEKYSLLGRVNGLNSLNDCEMGATYYNNADMYWDGVRDGKGHIITCSPGKLHVKIPLDDGSYKSLTQEIPIKYIKKICLVKEGIVAMIGGGELVKTEDNEIRIRKGLKLVVYDYMNGKINGFHIHKGNVADEMNLITLSDGNILIAYDQYITNDTTDYSSNFAWAMEHIKKDYQTLFHKIDAVSTLNSSELKTIFGRYIDYAGDYVITDVMEDNDGNLIGAYMGAHKSIGYHNDPDQTYYGYRELGLTKMDKNGNNLISQTLETLENNAWARGEYEESQIKMAFQDEIKFSSRAEPRLARHPSGKGYVLCTRLSWGVWQYITPHSTNGTGKDQIFMWSDQPALLFIDAKSLTTSSWDFIETTYETGVSHNTDDHPHWNRLSLNYNVTQFAYWPEKKKYVLLERGNGYNSHIWTTSADLDTDWNPRNVVETIDYIPNNLPSLPQKPTSTVAASTPGGDINSETNANTDEGPKYFGSMYFKHDYSGSDANSTKKRIYIHYGSSSTSTSRGSSCTVKCQNTKIYYSFTGKSSDKKFVMELSPSDCGKTIKTSSFL